jgi:protein SCO1
MNFLPRRAFPRIALGCAGLLLTLAAAACNKPPAPSTASPQSGAKRYPLKGKVVSVDLASGTANVAAEAIPGFMDAMTMPYEIHPASELGQLSPGDAIAAEVVVEDDKYWLENVRVIQHAAAPPPKPSAALEVPAPGDLLPDFRFTNQNGKRISLRQYRGRALLITFIYTRCPFPDYCPRLSRQFAEINRQLGTDPALEAKTHLLSISFDPAHDTPQVLRAYGLAAAGSQPAALFGHWEFVVPRAADLPELARFFGLTYLEDGAVITHSMSTAVIGPDGRIAKWYHDSDWQPGELIRAAADALHAAGSASKI